MNDFDLALRDLLQDRAIAEPCTYQPPTGPAVDLRAVIAAVDRESELFLTGAIVTRYRAMVGVEDLPSPVEGAQLSVAPADAGGLEYAGTTFVVRKFLLDAEGMSWTLGLDLA